MTPEAEDGRLSCHTKRAEESPSCLQYHSGKLRQCKNTRTANLIGQRSGEDARVADSFDLASLFDLTSPVPTSIYKLESRHFHDIQKRCTVANIKP